MTESGGSAAPAEPRSQRSGMGRIWLTLAVLSPALLLLAQLAPWPWLPALIGRAHPLFLHFPIALLLLAAAMEAIETVSPGRFRFAPAFVLFAGTFCAVLAATCGYLLMRVDAVEGARVERHLIGGVSVAVLAVIALLMQPTVAVRPRGAIRHGYRGLLLVLCGVVLLTGHDGAALTHGEDYLTEHLPWNAEKKHVAAAPKFPTNLPVERWAAYQHVVAPILETRCVACHSSTNFKGKLVLDQWEGITRGGKTGPLWVDGKPAESLLIERLLLPLQDEKHMPPKKKLQPTSAEITLLQLWVKAGSPAEGTPGALVNDQAWLAAVKKLPNVLMAAHQAEPTTTEEFHEVDPAKVAQDRAPVERVLAPLRTRFPGMISYESRESTDLRVNASLLGAAFRDDELTALAELRPWIVDLDLSETSVTDASAPLLAGCSRLRVLRLNGTGVGDATIAALAPLTQLESLSLYRTTVSDTAAETLGKLPGLRRVYADETKMSPATLASLQGRRPQSARHDGVN